MATRIDIPFRFCFLLELGAERMSAVCKSKAVFLAALLVLEQLPVQADEFNVAFGLFNFANEGRDVRVSYRLEQSHWQFAYKHVQWTDTFYDPFTGRAHSKTTETLKGLGVNYLFKNESRHTPYVGVSLLEWSRVETPLMVNAPSGASSTTDVYVGGGFMGRFGGWGYYNAGIFLSPTAKMYTQTAISSTESSGNFDIQLQVGLAW
jgi:hypothetical protein